MKTTGSFRPFNKNKDLALKPLFKASSEAQFKLEANLEDALKTADEKIEPINALSTRLEHREDFAMGQLPTFKLSDISKSLIVRPFNIQKAHDQNS